MATHEHMSGRISAYGEDTAHTSYYKKALESNSLERTVYFESRVFHCASMASNLVKEFLQKRIRNKCSILVNIETMTVPLTPQEQSEIEMSKNKQGTIESPSKLSTVAYDTDSLNSRIKTDPNSQSDLYHLIKNLRETLSHDERLLKCLAYYLCKSNFYTYLDQETLEKACGEELYGYVTHLSSVGKLNINTLNSLCGTRWKTDASRRAMIKLLEEMSFDLLLNN